MLEMRPEPIIHCFGESSRRSHNLPGKILWRLFLIADSIFPFFLKLTHAHDSGLTKKPIRSLGIFATATATKTVSHNPPDKMHTGF
ncbi:hypothetical protein K438DRAFT_1987101 [Mycena galopus ATCC 62051]|nr:hypothetical protein K438DRAFT_1987101 [Mycena galopus ATCC 62051]